MAFELRKYTHPDFTEEKFVNAPDATLVEAPRDGIAPDNFHALSIFPESRVTENGSWWKRAGWTPFRCLTVRRFRQWKRAD